MVNVSHVRDQQRSTAQALSAIQYKKSVQQYTAFPQVTNGNLYG